MLKLIKTAFLLIPLFSFAKNIDTTLFEKEPEAEKSSSKSFSAKVRVIREESDGVEVFFEDDKQKGAYFLLRSAEYYAVMLKTLETSKKADGSPVNVTVDSDKHIKNVEKKQSATKMPLDPNKKWDFGKLPD